MIISYSLFYTMPRGWLFPKLKMLTVESDLRRSPDVHCMILRNLWPFKGIETCFSVMLSHDKSMFMFFLSQKSLVQRNKNMKPENGPLEKRFTIFKVL